MTQRELEQWNLRITAYADELLDSLDRIVGWPDKVLTTKAVKARSGVWPWLVLAALLGLAALAWQRGWLPF